MEHIEHMFLVPFCLYFSNNSALYFLPFQVVQQKPAGEDVKGPMITNKAGFRPDFLRQRAASQSQGFVKICSKRLSNHMQSQNWNNQRSSTNIFFTKKWEKKSFILKVCVCVCVDDFLLLVFVQVYFDVSIGGKPAGRIVMGLYGKKVRVLGS